MPIVTTKQILKKLPDNFRLTSILEEAITNSIEANATEIDIYFETLPIDITEEKRRVKNFNIIDNGDGFTDDNIKSFNHYYSDFKETLGCKGVGRFTYLTLCDKARFTSYNNGSNIKFDFDLNMEEIELLKFEKESLIKKTKIDFINVHNRDINLNFQDEEKEIIGHFLSVFKFMVDEEKNLFIKFYIDDKLVSTIEAKEHGVGFKDDNFNIKVGQKNEIFTVSYKQKGVTIKGHYCADKRSVKQDTLGLKFRTKKDKGLLFFVVQNFLIKM